MTYEVIVIMVLRIINDKVLKFRLLGTTIHVSVWYIASFHTRDQLSRVSITTNEKCYMRIEFNSKRNRQGHNHGRYIWPPLRHVKTKNWNAISVLPKRVF